MLEESREPRSPITAPPACHPALLPLPALLSRKWSGFSSAAEPLRCGQLSDLTRPTGTKPLGSQDDASAVSKSGAQFRPSTGVKKLEQVSRTSLSRVVSSHIYPSIFYGLSTVLCLHSTHRLEGRGWLCCQAMAEGAEALLEGQSSHLPCLEDIRSQLLQDPNHLMFVVLPPLASAAFKGNCFSPYSEPGM